MFRSDIAPLARSSFTMSAMRQLHRGTCREQPFPVVPVADACR
jgi:hypothetical protein